MQMTEHNKTGLFPQYRCYNHAVEIRRDSRLLIVSGLNGPRFHLPGYPS
jgi:2-iminobutanoate/2-iminopropanoate deaminase